MDVQPYSRLAEHYDRLMGHVQYGFWANSLQKILKRLKHKPRRLLELGAGTCRLAHELDIPSLEFRIHTDLSLPMVRAAGAAFPYHRAACDGTALPFQGGFDLVLMCYDAVNYLPPQAMSKLFSEVNRVLESGGVFLFDITTEVNSIEWFEDYCDAFEADESMLVRRSSYEADKRIQHNYIDLFERLSGDQYRRISEHHVQYIYPVPQLCEWLEESGLQLVDLLDAVTLRPATPKSERIHFAVVKP